MAPQNMETDDWQLQCGEIKQRGAQLLLTGRWSDCSFLVGPEPDKVHIKTHKLILAMASPVFEAMFYGPVAEGNDPIPIPDMQPAAFQALIEYIYTDNITIQSTSFAIELYYGAQKYMLTHLLTVCSTYLSSNLTPKVVCRTYEFAKLVGENELMSECVKMMSQETQQVIIDSGFEEASLDTVVEIFSMDPLNVSNELQLFTAAERYVKANSEAGTGNTSCNVANEDHSQENPLKEEAADDAENVAGEAPECKPSTYNDNPDLGETDNVQKSENVKQLIRRALREIRFLTVKAEDLAEYQTLNSLLTDREILAIFMNIASKNTHMPMPDGFSTSREQRDRC